MATARNAIIVAAVAALNGVGKPAGLTIHRMRAKPIEKDKLPAAVVYIVSEPVKKAAPNATLVQRELRFRVEVRTTGEVPDEALDDYAQWVVEALMTDQSLGGVCRELSEVESEWDAVAADKTYAAVGIDFIAMYRTVAADPSTRVG